MQMHPFQRHFGKHYKLLNSDSTFNKRGSFFMMTGISENYIAVTALSDSVYMLFNMILNKNNYRNYLGLVFLNIIYL